MQNTLIRSFNRRRVWRYTETRWLKSIDNQRKTKRRSTQF